MNTLLDRRRMLAALGLGASSHFLPSLRRANAAATIPTRFIVFYTAHGTLPSAWKPTGPGGVGAATETSFDLGELHQPMAAYKNDLILLSGLDMRSWVKGPLQACGHVNGQTHSLTNIRQQTKDTAAGPSIDQYIAAGYKAQNGGVSPTTIPSLTLGVSGDNYYGNATFFSGPGASVPLESNPVKAYGRLFPGGMAPSTGGADASALVRRRKSAMDLAIGEFSAVAAQMGKEEKTKLDLHADAIRDLETRLAQMPTRSCAAPTAPKGNTSFTADGDAMIRLIQTGFACDLTRVASLWAGSPSDSMIGYSGGLLGTTDLHDLVHNVDGNLANDPTAVGVIKNFHKAYSKMFASLLGALKAIPESDGGTLLDHTVILWAGEIAQGGHGCTNLKWLLAGKGGGKFKTGRYLNWGDYNRGEYADDKSVPSNGDLFATIATNLGIPTTTFGDPAACNGLIDKLRA